MRYQLSRVVRATLSKTDGLVRQVLVRYERAAARADPYLANRGAG